ncbi:uncharacterized protein [Dermacentor albipictus]|uniref:uncharacterized protein n=1 Tax=Dermacentor albipictus TaxID=60249 RepID=UPI0031FBA51B
MAATRIDPNIVTICQIISDAAAEEEFVRSLRLAPASSAVRPPRPNSRPGRVASSEYWGTCKDLAFNPDQPTCEGEVVTLYRKTQNGRRAAFRCNRCRKQLSQLHGTAALHGQRGEGSYFANTDRLGRPNVHVSRRQVIWLTYCVSKNIGTWLMKEMTGDLLHLSDHVIADWRNYAREVVRDELLARPPLGGPGRIVQIDECLLRGKRKYNRGRLMTGDNVPPSRQNYGGIADRGPWVFGMICVTTGELRLFKVDRRDAATLGPIIAANVEPGTTIHSDEWAAYNCIPNLVGANGARLNLQWEAVNHSMNFVDPITGAHTQKIESYWQKVKRHLVSSGYRVTPQLLESHLIWLWWASINGHMRCKDSFLRLLEAIARRYPV